LNLIGKRIWSERPIPGCSNIEMILAGQVAVITGGAKGIGRASALCLAGAGAQVVIGDIDEESGRRTASEINDLGGSARFTRCDVSCVSDVKHLVGSAIEVYDKVTILHSNAAYLDDFKPAIETTDESWDKAMAVGLRGGFICAREVLPLMIEQRSGSIIFTASVLSHMALPSFSAYSTVKGGLLQLMRSLAVDYGQYNIRVNAICPGPIRTWPEGIEPPAEFTEMLRNRTILKRFGTPDEVAQCVLFLASNQSSFVTGSCLTVDGGWSAV
jgi:3-oxoacyl-[acyl-carrier protein] reductase